MTLSGNVKFAINVANYAVEVFKLHHNKYIANIKGIYHIHNPFKAIGGHFDLKQLFLWTKPVKIQIISMVLGTDGFSMRKALAEIITEISSSYSYIATETYSNGLFGYLSHASHLYHYEA